MTVNTITTDNLFQGGRVNAPDSSVGPSFLRYSSVLTANDSWVFQFPSASHGANTFGVPMSVFIDNALNPFAVDITVQSTQQSFPVPANTTGFYLIDAIAGSAITAMSEGLSTGAVEFIFYNYPRTPYIWYKFGATTTAVTVANGADVALGSTTDAAITNPVSSGTLIAFTKGILQTLEGSLKVTPTSDVYEAVAASQANQVLGGAGAVGDRLDFVIIQPATTAPGNVIINDGVTAIFTFPGGAASVSNLVPFVVPIGAACVGADWNITTGANVSVLASGKFT